MLNSLKGVKADISIIALVAANIVPLVGAVWFDWDVFVIVLLYWAENVIVGFYNILKMALAHVEHPIGHLPKLFMIPFFTVHYGGFAAVHGLFVMGLLGSGFEGAMEGPGGGPGSWPCVFVFLEMLINVVITAYSMIPNQVRLALLVLVVSHGISFVYNYLYKGEYKKASLQKLMGAPYGRVVVLHLAILFGAFISLALGSPAGVLILLVVIKTFIDLKLHVRSHKKAQAEKITVEKRKGIS